MPRRSKKIKLTQREVRLLEYPPVKEAWYCLHTYEDGSKSQVYNTGSSTKCIICGKKKPSRPKRPWAEYVAACEKVSIDPEEHLRWKVVGNVPMMRTKGGTWKKAPEILL
jgi:hypothetical protein